MSESFGVDNCKISAMQAILKDACANIFISFLDVLANNRVKVVMINTMLLIPAGKTLNVPISAVSAFAINLVKTGLT